MRVLVTGSRGTLGKPLVQALNLRGHEVWECDLQHHRADRYLRADVGDYRQFGRAICAAEPEVVYHLAAEFGRINGEEYYETLWRTNVIGLRHLLEWQQQHRFRVIFTSSSEIYGEGHEGLLTELLPHQQPVFPRNDYAISKWANELQILHLEERHNLEIMRLRLFNAYGPGEEYHKYRSVVCLFCYRALHNLPYQVFENYHRVFMYIDDLIPTMAAAVTAFVPGTVVNIGGTEYRSVKEVSDIILRELGLDDRLVEYLPEDRHNVTNKQPDIACARELLGHAPHITLEEGIPRTLWWMAAHYRRPTLLWPTKEHPAVSAEVAP